MTDFRAGGDKDGKKKDFKIGDVKIRQNGSSNKEDQLKQKSDKEDGIMQFTSDESGHIDQLKSPNILSVQNSNNNIISHLNRQSESMEFISQTKQEIIVADQKIPNSPIQQSGRAFFQNASIMSFSQPQSIVENNLIHLEDDSEYGDEDQGDKYILSQLEKNQSNSNSAKDQLQDNQKDTSKQIDFKIIKPFQIMYQSLVFISKLMRGSSSFRFRKITQRQFGIIDDFSSDFEYYVYLNPKIKTFVNIVSSQQYTHCYFIKYYRDHRVSRKCSTKSSAIFENGLVITDRRKIFSMQYSNFIKDLIVIIMFLISRSPDVSEKQSYLDYFIFIKLIDIPSKLNEIENKLQISQQKLKLLQLIQLEFFVVLIAHVLSCIFLRMGLQELESEQDNWISHFDLQDYSRSQLYVQSIYYMVITMTTIGYGDFSPVTASEKVYITIVALIATNVCAYSFSQISEIVKYEQDKKQTYLQMMQGINKEMNDIGLNILLQHKVRKYYEFQHNQGGEDRQNRLTLIENLPAQIKEEVLLDVNVEFLNQVSFINQLSKEFKKEISLSIKQKIFYPDEIVFKEKESNNCLFFISQGSITLTITIKTMNQLNQTQSEMNIETLKKKDIFGFEGFVHNIQNPYNAKANGYTVLSYIDREELTSLLQNYLPDYEKYCFMRDEVVLTGKYRLVNRKCISCGELIHSFRDCPKINPVFKKKNIQKEKNITMEREKQFLRKRVSYFHPLKDQFELAKKATRVMAKYDEESILSDCCSILMGEEEEDDEEDKQGEEGQDSAASQSNEEDKFEDVEKEEKIIQRRKKRSTYQEDESSDILNDEEEQQLENEKLKRQQKRSRNNKLVSLTDIQNFIQSINSEKSSKASNNMTMSASLKLPNKTRFSKFRNTTIEPSPKNYGQNLSNSTNTNQFFSDKTKPSPQHLDIIEENDEDIHVNLQSSSQISSSKLSPLKKRHESEQVNETQLEDKLKTINEFNTEQQENDSQRNNSFSMDTIQKDQQTEHANIVNIFSSPLSSPIHTIEQIKFEMNKQLSSQFFRQRTSSMQSQNSYLVSPNTLRILESELNQNHNHFFNSNLNGSAFNQQANINYNYNSNDNKNYINNSINSFNIDNQNISLQNDNADQINHHQNNKYNTYQIENLNINNNNSLTNNEVNNIINGLQMNTNSKSIEVNQVSNQSTKMSINRRISGQYGNEENESNFESHAAAAIVNGNLFRHSSTINMSENNTSYQEELKNISEDNGDTSFNGNRQKVKNYDIFEKIQMRRKMKGLQTYLKYERVIAKKLTQKMADINTTEDILNHLERKSSRRISSKKSLTMEQSQLNNIQNANDISPINSQMKQQQQQQQFQQPIEKNKPVLALTLARKLSKKQTRVNIAQYPSQIDPSLLDVQRGRRGGTIRLPYQDQQKELEQIQSPRRNAKIGTRVQGIRQSVLPSQPKMEKKQTYNTNSSILGSHQIQALNTSNILEHQNGIQGIAIEGNPESSEYQIRCQYDLQMLDLLIVRKYYMMQQQKGAIFNYIFVDDNEMDIDNAKEYTQYFPKQNLREILRIIRKNQSKLINQIYPNLKIGLPKNKSKPKRNKTNNKNNQPQKSLFNTVSIQKSFISVNSK